MNKGTPIFSQLIQLLDRKTFQKCVHKYDGDRGVKNFSCWDQFLCLAFAQITYRESLRDIEACLRGSKDLLYRMGFRCGNISRSTISEANQIRDSRIFSDYAWTVIEEARALLDDNTNHKLNLDSTVFALDSTIIDLCLSLFPWAKFRTTKAGIKIHTLLNLETKLPEFIDISEAKIHDSKVLPKIKLVSGAYYVMDRAYITFQYLNRFNLVDAYFVVRLKDKIKLRRLYSASVDKSSGLISDHTVSLVLPTTKKKYPELLRRVRYRDPETKKLYAFLTNNFSLPAQTICDLYRARWGIELFFKWLKQNLKVKSFYGNNENAVRIQIWVAITTYTLVLIAKKRLQIKQELYIILQVLSIQPFDKKPIKSAFDEYDADSENKENHNQLNLFTN